MTHDTIMFDKNCREWNENMEYDRKFVKTVISYLSDKLYFKGYIYLSDIYESFGVRWDPEWHNDCIRYIIEDNVIFETFETKKYKNAIVIHINL